METKQAIRERIFSLRRQVTDEEVDRKSRELTRRVLELPVFQRAERILAYVDYNHEVRTCYLIEEAWKAGKEVAVPKCIFSDVRGQAKHAPSKANGEKDGRRMIFRKLTDFSQLKKGYYGIPEPETGEEVVWEDALMIMPCVAFDERNHRIGYGGGYYDRYLEEHPEIFRLAAAFEFQRVPEAPVEPTDILPQLVVTEKQVYLTASA